MSGLHGNRAKMEDFMPWPKAEPEPATPEQVLAYLTNLVKRK